MEQADLSSLSRLSRLCELSKLSEWYVSKLQARLSKSRR